MATQHTLTSINPTTGLVLETYPALNAEGIQATIELAGNAWLKWRETRLNLRTKMMMEVAAELREQQQALAEMMAMEMGKPITQGLSEVEQAADCCEHYAEHAQGYLESDSIASDAKDSFVTYQPIGALLGVLGWQEPVAQAFHFLAPALMAGNACVLRHAPQLQGCAQMIVELMQTVFGRLKVPDANIVVNLPVAQDDIDLAIRQPAIQGVLFRGAASEGAQVAGVAAAEFKRTVLQLGSADPCIVLADAADLEKAADAVVKSRLNNTGQSSDAAKRILVEAPVYDAFIDLLKQRIASPVIGDPLLDDTVIGPIATGQQLHTIEQQVNAAIDAGARCACGGETIQRPGYYYTPTLLADVTPEMEVFNTDLAGPVIAVMKVDSFEHALATANSSPYGMAASIWTQKPMYKRQAILNLQAGQVSINGVVKTDPRLPSGGIKQSGYGRSLGPHGIREFTNAKQVWIGK